MFEAPFEHYLAYGATDQRTVQALAGRFTGLIVPGTVAAFQREGTGGFVLTLSASQYGTPYTIDPRFPLFQQPLLAPKKSHYALAELLGGHDLISEKQPRAGAFTDEWIDHIASCWASFNSKYRDSASSKFKKYAERLNERVAPENALEPKYVLAPYMVASGPDDPWWDVSCKLYERTVAHVRQPESCIRVMAATEARFLEALLDAMDSPRIAIWVSRLDELTLPSRVLSEYASAIRKASRAGKQTFALYGGFFSVLLSSVGLGGSCHGIGYGEYRDYLELPRSGPPPARYYLPSAHRYVSQELAFQLWQSDPGLAECDCEACNRQSPIDLDYHSLMRHSVLRRSKEIDEWVALDLVAIVDRLTNERRDFLMRLEHSNAPEFIKSEARRNVTHLQEWIDALAKL